MVPGSAIGELLTPQVRKKQTFPPHYETVISPQNCY